MPDDVHPRPPAEDPTARPYDERPAGGGPSPAGTWVVAEVAGAVPPAHGPHGHPWLTFDGDGVLYGHAGVNRVRSTWSLDGGRLTVGPVVQTMMAGPDDVTRTEVALVAALTAGGTLEPADDGLALRTADGTTLLLRPAPPGTGASGGAGHALR
ncbi:META domain-containing protein [Cellulomonas oligotrophica]|uniref:Heat shock protein HslJ n=1 Tax=Cellulomonas oligotrophica TaxID=931536 RepID=A0A7Y9JX43_9CELL|nr:META domain-containing protein [Cellulomonas oligotrophica]NYD85262.1 heat shock protein HslJ [Cellulomonas oligotrophica]GIG33301.1 hypothetical protein Col01nite_24600 [Cellulomonas oligotrophica]